MYVPAHYFAGARCSRNTILIMMLVLCSVLNDAWMARNRFFTLHKNDIYFTHAAIRKAKAKLVTEPMVQVRIWY